MDEELQEVMNEMKMRIGNWISRISGRSWRTQVFTEMFYSFFVQRLYIHANKCYIYNVQAGAYFVQAYVVGA